MTKRHEKAPAWEGWYFEDDYLVNPRGTRYTPQSVDACEMIRQMRHHASLLYPGHDQFCYPTETDRRERRLKTWNQLQHDRTNSLDQDE